MHVMFVCVCVGGGGGGGITNRSLKTCFLVHLQCVFFCLMPCTSLPHQMIQGTLEVFVELISDMTTI